MPLRLVKDSEDKSIPMRELHNGQVAEIVAWDSPYPHLGEIVRREHDRLVNLSRRADGGWEPIPQFANCRVRVIPNGIVELEVFDNE